MDRIYPQKPEIITSGIVEVDSFFDQMNPQEVIPALLDGVYVLIEDYYHNGLQVLKQLKKVLEEKYDTSTYLGQRKFRAAYNEASNRVLLMVVEGELYVKKSPEIGWFSRLYPNESPFLISFPDVQGLNSSWQWYLNGLDIDVLDITIHPYYGVYFPTRFDHIELFDSWLNRYPGRKGKAIDIGVGSGILSFQLLQHGFSHVFGTDINPNAIIGTQEEAERMGFSDRLTLVHGDLFADSDIIADLIVFNPPWIEAKHDLQAGIDKAIYYPKDLFPRFFERAKHHLAQDGKLIVLFSNLAKVTGVAETHPIRQELENNTRFRQEKLLRQNVKAGSKKTKRKDFRENEQVELWVLAHQ